ncbi:MAG: hypothetical protein ABSH28_01540 [Acidobacteriota bacterium]|jgi:tRNA U34 5-carboxymethylaminomethyl modifying enzyme MnmG/GidA
MIKMKDIPTLLALHLKGLPGLSRAARDALLQRQPATVVEALRIHGVGRKTTKRLLALGLLADPKRVQTRARTAKEMGLDS